MPRRSTANAQDVKGRLERPVAQADADMPYLMDIGAPKDNELLRVSEPCQCNDRL